MSELEAERDLVPQAQPGPIPLPRPRWPRYAAVAAAVAVVLGVGWGTSRLFRGGDPIVAAVAAGQIVIDGQVTLPIAGGLGTLDARGHRLEVVAGLPAPPLAMDLDLDGSEQPLVAAAPSWDQNAWAGDVTLVYIGDRSGRSIFVHTNGTIGFFDRLFAAGDIGDHICMSIGDSNSPSGGAGFCSSAASSHGGRFHDNSAGAPVDAWWVTWIDVPSGTAIVTADVAGEPLAWQAPVGETAFFDLTEPPTGMVTLTAIGVDGTELGSQKVPVGVFG